MTEFELFLSRVRSDVESALDRLLPAPETEPIRLHEAIRWSVFGGGKRIRPAILFAVGNVFGASRENMSNVAAAIEMIHTYSLVHDDLPAMDDDDLRRGRATCHKRFDEATAILAGDALQALAFQAISDDESLPAETRIKIVSVLAKASGTPEGMVSGQQLDLDAEGESTPLEQIEQIHRQKTGALITAAATTGAMIAGVSNDEVLVAAKYGEKLGLLFQITDDLLDVTQTTLVLGKTAGKDAAAQKSTYPRHYGLQRSVEIAREIRDDACRTLSTVERDTRLLQILAYAIADRTS